MTHGEPRCQDLGPPLHYPWSESVKLLEGRAAAANFLLCVVCVVCVVLCFACVFYSFLANQLVEIDGDKVQISKLCSTVKKKATTLLDVPAWNDSYLWDITSHLTGSHPSWSTFLRYFNICFFLFFCSVQKYSILTTKLFIILAKCTLVRKKGVFPPLKTKAKPNCTPPIFATAHTHPAPVHGGVWAVLRVSISAWKLALNRGRISAWVGCSTLQYMGKISTLMRATTQNTTTTHNNQHELPPPYPTAALALSLHGQAVGATNQWRRCFLLFPRKAPMFGFGGAMAGLPVWGAENRCIEKQRDGRGSGWWHTIINLELADAIAIMGMLERRRVGGRAHGETPFQRLGRRIEWKK